MPTKTEEETRYADQQEAEIHQTYEQKTAQAYREFHDATIEEWNLYESIWKPARERWQEFVAPHFQELRSKLTNAEREKNEAISKVVGNWYTCTICGKSASRYQVTCTDDKCKGRVK